MFYEGDLQSGIAKAVQEAKLVGCFVTGRDYTTQHLRPFQLLGTEHVASDEGEESQLWETNFLQEDPVSVHDLRETRKDLADGFGS